MSNTPHLIAPTWAAAIADWDSWTRAEGQPPTTRGTRRQHLQHLARRVDVGPWDLTGHDLLVFFAGQDHWKPETRRCRAQTFRVFYVWAIAQGHVETSPAAALPRMKPGRPNPMPCPDPVVAQALLLADERETLMLRLAEHGLRRCEVAVVHSRDLMSDLTGTSLVVHGKGRKDRVVPLTDATAALLRARPQGYAFPGAIDGHLSARRVGELMTRVLSGDWTMHKLRHRAATHFHEQSGHDLAAVQELLGHESIVTTRAYVKVRDERLREIINRAVA